MTHTKKCPNCKNVVDSGHGDPLKYLGSPLKTCPYCRKNYIDSDTIEWSISPLYRKIGYCFANNRIWICLVPSIICAGVFEKFLAFLICFVIIFSLCCLYVKHQVNDEIEASKRRTSNPQYVAILKASDYPIKEKIF